MYVQLYSMYIYIYIERESERERERERESALSVLPPVSHMNHQAIEGRSTGYLRFLIPKIHPQYGFRNQKPQLCCTWTAWERQRERGLWDQKDFEVQHCIHRQAVRRPPLQCLVDASWSSFNGTASHGLADYMTRTWVYSERSGSLQYYGSCTCQGLRSRCRIARWAFCEETHQGF